MLAVIAAVVFLRSQFEAVPRQPIPGPPISSGSRDTQIPNAKQEADKREAAAKRIREQKTLRAQQEAQQQQLLNEQEAARRRAELARRDADARAYSDALSDATRTNNADAEPLKRYLDRFPDGAYATRARKGIEMIETALRGTEELKRIFNQFSIRENTEITSNSPYKTEYFSNGGQFIAQYGGEFPYGDLGFVECMALCSRRSTCLAFTSDGNACRSYDSLPLKTTSIGNCCWKTGVRR